LPPSSLLAAEPPWPGFQRSNELGEEAALRRNGRKLRGGRRREGERRHW